MPVCMNALLCFLSSKLIITPVANLSQCHSCFPHNMLIYHRNPAPFCCVSISIPNINVFEMSPSLSGMFNLKTPVVDMSDIPNSGTSGSPRGLSCVQLIFWGGKVLILRSRRFFFVLGEEAPIGDICIQQVLAGFETVFFFVPPPSLKKAIRRRRRNLDDVNGHYFTPNEHGH